MPGNVLRVCWSTTRTPRIAPEPITVASARADILRLAKPPTTYRRNTTIWPTARNSAHILSPNTRKKKKKHAFYEQNWSVKYKGNRMQCNSALFSRLAFISRTTCLRFFFLKIWRKETKPRVNKHDPYVSSSSLVCCICFSGGSGLLARVIYRVTLRSSYTRR